MQPSLACSALFQVLATDEDNEKTREVAGQGGQKLADEDVQERGEVDKERGKGDLQDSRERDKAGEQEGSKVFEEQRGTKGGMKTSEDIADIEITSPDSYVNPPSVALSMTTGSIVNCTEVTQTVTLTNRRPHHEMTRIYNFSAVSQCTSKYGEKRRHF